MDLSIPAGVFEDSPVAVLMADATGAVRVCNPAAATLLKCERNEVLGQPCWTVARFRTPAGRLFCSPNCPVQRKARTGRPEKTRQISIRPPRGPSRPAELLTFALRNGGEDRAVALHMILPNGTGPAVDRVRDHPVDPAVSKHLKRLTRRERQVLRELSRGMGTGAVAERLAISRATVRNHVQSILGKLEVHRRIEAVVALLDRKR